MGTEPERKILIVDDESILSRELAKTLGDKAEVVKAVPEPAPKPFDLKFQPRPEISRKTIKKLIRQRVHQLNRAGNALPCEKSNSQLRRERKAAGLQSVLDDGKPREIVVQEGGSIKAVDASK